MLQTLREISVIIFLKVTYKFTIGIKKNKNMFTQRHVLEILGGIIILAKTWKQSIVYEPVNDNQNMVHPYSGIHLRAF